MRGMDACVCVRACRCACRLGRTVTMAAKMNARPRLCDRPDRSAMTRALWSLASPLVEPAKRGIASQMRLRGPERQCKSDAVRAERGR